MNIMSVAQYKWPNQFDQTIDAHDSYRDYYKFGDSIFVWDEATEEIQTLGSLIGFSIQFVVNYVVNFTFFRNSQTYHGHLVHPIVISMWPFNI